MTYIIQKSCFITCEYKNNSGGYMFNNIKKIRLREKLSQRELAIKLNISRTTVTCWEAGTNNPRTDMLPKLAKALNCSISELLGE